MSALSVAASSDRGNLKKPDSDLKAQERIFRFLSSGSGRDDGFAKVARVGANLLLHVTLAMIVCPIIAAIGTAIVNPIAKSLPPDLAYIFAIMELAIFILSPGLVLGYFVKRTTQRGTPIWVSLIGVTWMTFGVYEAFRRYAYQPKWYGTCSAIDNAVNTFFLMDQNRCGGGSEVLDGVLFTMPALASLAYALGSWIATRRLQARSRQVGG